MSGRGCVVRRKKMRGSMGRKIAIVGAGAVGGYAGAHMVQAGEDVTFIDPWPEHVEHMRKHGLRVTHAMDVTEFSVPVRALHVTDAQQLAKEKPVDIAFVCMKSYDTAWATMLIQQYLAADGYVVSLQNCMNEETIAGIVGWGKTLGCIASSITVNLPEPGHIHRGAGKGGAAHTVFRAGEVHGRITPRAEEVCRLVGYSDSAKVTDNLWGERWSKLVANVMGNGLSACTGLPGAEILQSEPLRRFSTRLGSEAIRVGQAQGYQLEEILHLAPEAIALTQHIGVLAFALVGSVLGHPTVLDPDRDAQGWINVIVRPVVYGTGSSIEVRGQLDRTMDDALLATFTALDMIVVRTWDPMADANGVATDPLRRRDDLDRPDLHAEWERRFELAGDGLRSRPRRPR